MHMYAYNVMLACIRTCVHSDTLTCTHVIHVVLYINFVLAQMHAERERERERERGSHQVHTRDNLGR